MNVTIIKLALPQSVAQDLEKLSPEGVDLGQYSVAVLTEYCASKRAESNAKPQLQGAKPSQVRVRNREQSTQLRRISEDELLDAIVGYLKSHGNASAKPDVEDAIFKKYEADFSESYYTGLVGGGVPRWKKNVQFAANTGRNRGLLKPSDESGRGIWELTEKGRMH